MAVTTLRRKTRIKRTKTSKTSPRGKKRKLWERRKGHG